MSIKNFFTKAKNVFLDALFPEDIKCILCDKDISNPDNPICNECLKEDIFNSGARCQVCDDSIKEGNIICDNCKQNKRYFEKCVCPFVYKDKIRKSILKFKSDNGLYLAKHYAKFMYEQLEKENIKFDIIVPVPSHKSTISKRGYNPAKVLADQISSLSGKPVKEVLVKNIKTKNQKLLSASLRQENLKDSIVLTDKSAIKNKTILLVDDVVTTCATINTCSNLLVTAKKIYVTAIARNHIHS